MARVKQHLRDATTGAGLASKSVAVRRKNGGSAVATETTDADRLFSYEANCSPGDVEWTATDAGTTRIVAGDKSDQTGHWYTGEIEDFVKGFSAGVVKNGDN